MKTKAKQRPATKREQEKLLLEQARTIRVQAATLAAQSETIARERGLSAERDKAYQQRYEDYKNKVAEYMKQQKNIEDRNRLERFAELRSAQAQAVVVDKTKTILSSFAQVWATSEETELGRLLKLLHDALSIKTDTDEVPKGPQIVEGQWSVDVTKEIANGVGKII
jgi:hypothetical protein